MSNVAHIMSVHPPNSSFSGCRPILDEEDFEDPLNRIQTSNGKNFLKLLLFFPQKTVKFLIILHMCQTTWVFFQLIVWRNKTMFSALLIHYIEDNCNIIKMTGFKRLRCVSRKHTNFVCFQRLFFSFWNCKKRLWHTINLGWREYKDVIYIWRKGLDNHARKK